MAQERSSDPLAPASILRGTSSSPNRQNSRPTFALASRRSSTQERLDEILETGRERANAMGSYGSWSSARSSNALRLPQASEHDEAPDETTGIIMRGNGRNYQATQPSTPPAARSPDVRPSNGHADGNDASHGSEEKQWWQDYLTSVWSIELENKGSTARDHLALERTFLAWLRTSLAFASIGIAITQLFRLNTSLSDGLDDQTFQRIRRLGKPLGATFLAISILVLFLGYQRYFQAQQWVMKGKFPASRGTIVLVSLIAFALMVASLVVVVVIQPSSNR
ncbi:hypothetical protein BX600DRAFT_494192 [Xylariales sp. PMI_506]|nr:hypothetical protein BX600DRAFT_494192 [Xylariales sp. PMI_506]